MTITLNLLSRPKTGADLVAYWRSRDLIGTRPDIADSQEHARAIRAKAEGRGRPLPRS